MSEKKRTAEEVEKFLSEYKKEISRKLEAISLTRLTKEEINRTKEEIIQCKAAIKDKNAQIKKQTIRFKEVQKENSSKSKKGKKTTSLLETSPAAEEYHNGIRIWNPEEEILEEEKQEEQIENE